MSPSERLAALVSGENPAMIARMHSGFAVLGDYQYLKGYSLLLAYPQVAQLNDLNHARRLHFLDDMAHLGDAVKQATGCRLINYAIYGNQDSFLHAHVWPRYSHEPKEYVKLPPFSIPEAVRHTPEHKFHVRRHGDLLRQIAERLTHVEHREF
jgi:diadenosine tetraphosphate (Ap4A) HIT family hydrolase